ncbi:MAG: hypothetical protein ACQER9_01010 [Nanobdellota archaeon]
MRLKNQIKNVFMNDKKRKLKRLLQIAAISVFLTGCGIQDKNKNNQVEQKVKEEIIQVENGNKTQIPEELKHYENLSEKIIGNNDNYGYSQLSYQNYKKYNPDEMSLSECRLVIEGCFLIGSKDKGSLYYLLSKLLDTNWENKESKNKLIIECRKVNAKSIKTYMKANNQKTKQINKLEKLNEKTLNDFEKMVEKRLKNNENLSAGQVASAGGYYTQISKLKMEQDFNKKVINIMQRIDELLQKELAN